MKKLISRFEEDLKISWKDARSRVRICILCAICAIVIIAISFAIFPYNKSYIETKVLPNGPNESYTPIPSVPDTAIEVKEGMLKWLFNGSLLVAHDKTHILCITLEKKNGNTYQHYYKMKNSINLFTLSYNISFISDTVKEGVVSYKCERSDVKTFFYNFLIPFLFFCFFFSKIIERQSSKDFIDVPTEGPFSESKTIKLNVWFKDNK